MRIKPSRGEIINTYKINNNLEKVQTDPEIIEVIISDTVPDYSYTYLAYLKIVITILVYTFIGVLLLWLFGAFSERVQNIMGVFFVLMIISTFLYRLSKLYIRMEKNNV